MRFGLIGAGRIGRIHGRNAASHPGSELVALADADAKAAESLAADTGAKVDSIDGVLNNPSIDAILVCAPTDMHADLIEKAVRNRKAVFCEKPVDLSADRIRACLKVVENAGAPLMIGFNRRFDPNFAALKSRLADGIVGDIELIHIISRDPGPPPASYIARSGGLFRDMMIHDFDLARHLLGEEPVSVFAAGSSLVDKAIGEAGDVDTAAVILETKSGKIAQISNSRRATYGYDQRIEVHGSKGLIRAQNVHETTVEIATEKGFLADPVQNFFLERYANAYRLELEHFVNAVEKGEKPTPSGYDGLRAQLLSDAATESAQTHRRVEIPA
jgi:myo-inositol 2-dehydrogenase / D-chiro-inositol 1-dehydrogenase